MRARENPEYTIPDSVMTTATKAAALEVRREQEDSIDKTSRARANALNPEKCIDVGVTASENPEYTIPDSMMTTATEAAALEVRSEQDDSIDNNLRARSKALNPEKCINMGVTASENPERTIPDAMKIATETAAVEIMKEQAPL